MAMRKIMSQMWYRSSPLISWSVYGLLPAYSIVNMSILSAKAFYSSKIELPVSSLFFFWFSAAIAYSYSLTYSGDSSNFCSWPPTLVTITVFYFCFPDFCFFTYSSSFWGSSLRTTSGSGGVGPKISSKLKIRATSSIVTHMAVKDYKTGATVFSQLGILASLSSYSSSLVWFSAWTMRAYKNERLLL